MIRNGQLFQVRLNGEVFGVVVDGETVIEAPPEQQWAVGKTFGELAALIGSRGGWLYMTGWPPVLTDNSNRPREADEKTEGTEDRWFGSAEGRRRKKRKR